MKRVRVIQRAEEFPELRELWLGLASGARATRGETPPTLFQSYDLNRVAARVFARRERPHVVVVESDSAAVIIPACVRGRSVSLLGEELFDYRQVLGSDEALIARGWEEIARLGLPLEIKAVRGEATSGFRAQAFAGAPYRRASAPLRRNKDIERNWRGMMQQGLKPRIYFPGHHPAEAGFPGGQARGNARDGGRRSYGEEKRILHSAQDDGSYLAQVRRMYELKGRQESGSLFRDPLRVDAVVAMVEAWPCELHVIERDADLVAAVLTFIDGNTCRFYGTYYDARWARYSPGIALLYRALQRAQERGLDFDFMTGEQPYKLRFATDVVPLYTVHGFEREVAAA